MDSIFACDQSGNVKEFNANGQCVLDINQCMRVCDINFSKN